MKLNKLTLSAAVLSVAVGSAWPALAADNAKATAETQGNVSYVSGGVGDDEAAAMKSAAASYPLELHFVQKAQPRDEFLADVKVRITDRSKNVVLDAVANGPFLLAKLPSGRYDVEVDYSGVVKRRTVEVKTGKHQRAVFVWAAGDGRESVVEAPTGATTAR
jgi:hypothetical protein